MNNNKIIKNLTKEFMVGENEAVIRLIRIYVEEGRPDLARELLVEGGLLETSQFIRSLENRGPERIET